MRDLIRLQHAARTVALGVAALWAILVIADLLWLDLGRLLGVYPRSIASLHGILTSPLAHGSAQHLAANTPALLVLGIGMLYGFPRAAPVALSMIWIGSGTGVWLFGRASFHLGASGLTHGMFFFVFLVGILRRDRLSVALALIAFFLYGGMVWGVFPQGPGVSFESHLFGALAGAAAAVWLRDRDPLMHRRLYEWPQEPADDIADPVIGDLWKDADEPEVSRPRQPEDDERRG
jgi:membrane associated rhomboid family serine protease